MKYISESYLTVRYAETDMMGIVHHSRYYPWFEVARTDFIKKTGVSYSGMEKMGIQLPLVETHARYLHGLRYEDEVLVTAELAEMKAAKCRFEYKVYKLPEKQLMSEGYTVHGFVDDNFAPMNLKKRFPEIWGKLSDLM